MGGEPHGRQTISKQESWRQQTLFAPLVEAELSQLIKPLLAPLLSKLVKEFYARVSFAVFCGF